MRGLRDALSGVAVCSRAEAVARRCAFLLAVCAGAAFAAPPLAGGMEHASTEVVVKTAAQECFVGLVKASGYLTPRATAVVMFNAPGYRLSEIKTAIGKSVARGEIVARAVATTASSDSNAPADVPIKALASGLVLQSSAFVGQPTSQADEPLFTLAVDGEIEAVVSVPSVHVLKIRAGQVAHIDLREGGSLIGHVRAVAVTIDLASQMGEARLSIDTQERWTPGRYVRATIEASRSCGLGVPRAALHHTATGVDLQIVVDRHVKTRSIRLGLSNETDVEVLGGLSGGELVVTNASGALRDGDRVKPITPGLQDAD